MSGHECDDALTNLYQYLDREIEHSTSEVIRAHLEDCSGCLKSFDFEARLQIVVRERLAEEVPPEFLARLRDAIAREAASS
jgi:anti-sigma factor (TIGR02949 family)